MISETAQPRSPAVHPDRWIAVALIALGATTLTGWLLHRPALVEVYPGLVPMVFNTGLGFVLAGAGLFASGRGGRSALPCTLFATALMTLGMATLLEYVFRLDLGIDFGGLHAWYDDGNTQPGRMAPNTAFAFVLIGITLLASNRVHRRSTAIATVALTFLLLAVGMTGLVGYLLAPELLFGWGRSARMAVHTAIGVILAGLALWLSWSRSDWYVQERYIREDGKIRILSSALLILGTTTAGLSGFVLLQRSLENQLESRLTAVTEARGLWLHALAAQVSAHAQVAIDDPAPAPLAPRGPTCAEFMPEKASRLRQRLLEIGYRGGTIDAGEAGAAETFGTFAEWPMFEAPLDESGTIAIVWDGVPLLRSRHVIRSGGQRCGTVVVDDAVPEIARLLFNTAQLGASAEVSACVLRDGRLVCLPNVFNTKPFSVLVRAAPARPLPMQFAVAGEKGVVYTTDYRGRNVVAAYGQLAPGLGFVAKQETAEAYAPIRLALSIGAPLILFVALVGVLAMHSQLSPLVRRMRRSEAAASDAAAKTRTVMEAAGDGMVTIDEHGLVESANGAAHALFGYLPGSLVGCSVSALVPTLGDPAARGALSQSFEHLSPNASPSRRDLHLEGVRIDGTAFALELTINVVSLGEQRLRVAVMRDISARKEAEDRLSHLAQHDSLTGLPNRALFMDRLGTALLRGTRSQHAVALMFLDVDGFKGVNDRHGHDVGDELLKRVAGRLTAAVRKSDTVARLGGDEFTIVLEDLTHPPEDADQVAAKVIAAMRAPFAISGLEIRVSASIGLVVRQGNDVDADVDVALMLRRADEAMYRVKRAGRNAVSRLSLLSADSVS